MIYNRNLKTTFYIKKIEKNIFKNCFKKSNFIYIFFMLVIVYFYFLGIAERRIVCYYTNWSVYRPGTAKFSPQNINPYLCTHLIYAFGGFTKENALKPFDKYQDIEKGTKI